MPSDRREGGVTVTRLGTVAPDLVELLRDQPPTRRRTVALHASGWIVESTDLANPRIDAVFLALRDGRLGETDQREAVKQLEDELDERARGIREDLEAGRAGNDEYLAAFARARAAGAVWWAMDDLDLHAALEAVHEAQAATGELGAVRRLIEEALG